MKTIVLIFILFAFSPISVLSQPFTTQSAWEEHFKNKINELDPIEGIYSSSRTIKYYDKYNKQIDQTYSAQYATFAIYKTENVFKVYIIDTNQITSNSYTTLISTASNGIYLMQVNYTNTNTTSKANAILTGNTLLEFTYEMPSSEISHVANQIGVKIPEGIKVFYENQWIKTFPTITDYKISTPASGTGFGILSSGIIVTNYHVIDGAKIIKVRGINSDFSKTYNAKILVSDKTNDLVLIQIDEPGFTTLGSIPFTMKFGLAEVGECVFVLGYPLRSTMGDEIKLTNGIVSSKTGFKGDITSYQISAPVQPGNSGGPVFDINGNLIGIINAKHGEAENASYAIKSNYLSNLFALLPSTPKLQTVNSLSGKSLPQQVELAKKYVYIIETE